MNNIKLFSQWFFLAIFSLLAKFINLFLAWLVTPFANKEGWLPSYLSWFQTPDNSLDGDKGWREEHMPYKEDKAGFQRWVNRSRWLIRNSMYGFKIDVLGFKLEEGFKFRYIGNPEVSDRPLSEGWVLRTATNPDDKKAFQFYLIYPWSEKYCLRLMFGWKLWQKPTRGNKQLALSVMPFKSYVGEIDKTGNGCGPSWMCRGLKDLLFNWFYETSCDKHDNCYLKGTTELNRLSCDWNLFKTMLRDAGKLNKTSRLIAYPQAIIFFIVVLLLGWTRFNYKGKEDDRSTS